MSLDKAINHPEIGPIIKANPDVLSQTSDEGFAWKDELTLFVFMLYEWSKGDASFWKPYLDLMPEDDTLICDWQKEDILGCQDADLEKLAADQ